MSDKPTIAQRLEIELAEGSVDIYDDGPTISIPTPGDDLASIARTVRALKGAVDILYGTGVSVLDKALTPRDMLAAGTFGYTPTTGLATAGGTGVSTTDPVGYTDPRPVINTPAAPTGFEAFGGFRSVILRWDNEAYANRAYTEVWRHTVDNLAAALAIPGNLIGQPTANIFNDTDAATSVRYYYWIRDITTSNVQGAFTASVTAGVQLIGNTDFGPLVVEAAALANNAVTAVKIEDNAIIAGKISANTIVAGDGVIANAAITNAMIDRLSVDRLAVTAADIVSVNASTITTGTLNADLITTGGLNANRIAVGTLSANQIASGTLNSSLIFAGALSAATGTFSGSLSAATGTFSGSLSAATGTFSGSLSAATGTFAGELSAATGTFAGSLSAATGTFAGELSAATGTFSGTLSAAAIKLAGESLFLPSYTSSSSSDTLGTGTLLLTSSSVDPGPTGSVLILLTVVDAPAYTDITVEAGTTRYYAANTYTLKRGSTTLATFYGTESTQSLSFNFMDTPGGAAAYYLYGTTGAPTSISTVYAGVAGTKTMLVLGATR